MILDPHAKIVNRQDLREYKEAHDYWQARATAAEAREVKLLAALATFIYETTHLSPMEADGSYWCKISADCLSKARAAIEENQRVG